MCRLKELPGSLKEMESFSRQDFTRAMASDYSMTEPQAAYDLKKRLDQGTLMRAGWGRYSPPVKQTYRHHYSDSAVDVVKTISEGYDGLDFQVFELIQLNEFINHQAAHNTIFVTVENDLVEHSGKPTPERCCSSQKPISTTDIDRMKGLLSDGCRQRHRRV